MNEITIKVGDELFRFESFQQWVDKAKGWFKSLNTTSYNTICVDAKGRLCTCGAEFQRARDENAFPVRVYAAIFKEQSKDRPIGDPDFCREMDKSE